LAISSLDFAASSWFTEFHYSTSQGRAKRRNLRIEDRGGCYGSASNNVHSDSGGSNTVGYHLE
jgi:hypothetical protein